MDTLKTRIKPLLPHAIHIKSLHTYQNYLIKRPKHTLIFKIARQGALLLNRGNENQTKAELKLQKAISLLKSVKKVDLSGFQVKGGNLNRNRFLSCFKHSSISRISTLHWTRHQFYNNLGANFAERPLKYLPKLQNLTYELTSQGMVQRDPTKDPCQKDPLRHLSCCPKVESLQIRTSGPDYDFSKIFSGFHKYPASRKHLALKLFNKDGTEDFALHLENLSKLESACFKFVENSLIWKIDGLSDLPRLQEMSLEFQVNIIPGIDLMLRKIAEKKILKKIRLIFPDSIPADEGILEALQDFNQLTHFELSTPVQNDETLKTISKCLENLKQLQDLRLTLSRQFGSESFDGLKALCQKITDLQSLRHLHLSFCPIITLAEIPNFILLCGPIQLETLSLTYTQLDPTLSLLGLSMAIKTSLSSLRKLKISFRSFSPDQDRQKFILRFLISLQKIKTLEMIGLDVEDDNFLYQIVRVIYSLKDLREFTIGEIKDKVTPSVYENMLQAILSKRGLERFECKTAESLLESCRLSAFDLLRGHDLYSIDMEMVEMKNPFIESIKISDAPYAIQLLGEIVYWW